MQFYENVKFGVILSKIDIFVNNHFIKIKILKSFHTYVTHINVIKPCFPYLQTSKAVLK